MLSTEKRTKINRLTVFLSTWQYPLINYPVPNNSYLQGHSSYSIVWSLVRIFTCRLNFYIKSFLSVFVRTDCLDKLLCWHVPVAVCRLTVYIHWLFSCIKLSCICGVKYLCKVYLYSMNILVSVWSLVNGISSMVGPKKQGFGPKINTPNQR